MKSKDYKNCLKVTQLKNKITHLDKNEIDVDSLEKIIKTSKKNNNKLKI